MKLQETQNIFSIRTMGDPESAGECIKGCESLPLLPTRNLVLFPKVAIPITLGRQSSLATAEKAERDESWIGVVCQRDASIDNPTVADLCEYGVYAKVIKVIELPDESRMALVQAGEKFKIVAVADSDHGQLAASVKTITELCPKDNDKEFQSLSGLIKETGEQLMKLGADRSNVTFNIDDIRSPERLINSLASLLPFDPELKMQMLAKRHIRQRGEMLLAQLMRNSEMMEMTRELQRRAKSSLDDKQRSMFLQQQMEEIRSELYGEDDDAEELRKRAEAANLPEHVMKVFTKELEKLRRIASQSPDYSVQYTYLLTLLDLPWGVTTPLVDDFKAASDVLENDHYGLEKVKDRILEQLAVMVNNPDGRSPIICLVGPPGVGKTSLGQSIARALGRKYQRVSLGGINDEAEIRGHRRTYIGALPGRIIDAVKRSGSSNPVILLDEVDKIGRDFKGDPSAALLEVLDPEQNCHFHDNYVDIDFDLSKVLFIATANTLTTLSQPLLDRMEVIDIAGYLPEEKVAIARNHLLPRITKELDTQSLELVFPDETLYALIDQYTSESGVRQLEKRLAQVIRKHLLASMRHENLSNVISPDDLQPLLGAPIYTRDRYEGNDYAGVVTGLAWTAVGGEILYIESSLSPGKADKPTLTGNLGDVMKESAIIALQYVRSHAETLGVDTSILDRYALHIHVPEGAIPKDGPSAGITMATSIVSALRQTRVKERMAMTGEITLRGRVLPVGGIKEKILAAKRAGITDIILSEDNRKDVSDIAERYLTGLTFHYVRSVDQVIDLAVTDTPVASPLSLA